MSKPWPPPPDLSSIDELVANADIEGFIADGAHPDEYESEAELLYEAIKDYPTAGVIAQNLTPIIEGIWAKNFSLDDNGIAERKTKFRELAEEIERFFGPAAKPQVRGA
jgi:hypothetical protein